SRIRSGAHRIRTAFSTRVLPRDVSSIRYTPAGAARPSASRPFQAKAYTPAAPGPSCNVRTSVPSTRYTRSANLPSRSSETGILASGLKGFGRTAPTESTRGAWEPVGIVTRTGPYSEAGAPSCDTTTQYACVLPGAVSWSSHVPGPKEPVGFATRMRAPEL